MPKFRVYGNVMYSAYAIVEAEDAEEALYFTLKGRWNGPVEIEGQVDGFEGEESSEPELIEEGA
jgi:hypothetical protein